MYFFRKNQIDKALLAFLIVFFLITKGAYALSLFDFFFNSNQSTSSQKDYKRKDTVQSLRFLESNTAISERDENTAISKEMGDEPTLLAGTNLDYSSDADTSDDGINAGSTVYTVTESDSLDSIAKYFGVSVDTIVSYNKLPNRKVKEGDVLEIPSVSGVLYTIKKGDTLSKISIKYKVDKDDVTLYNGLFGDTDLTPGDEIFLPGAEGGQTPLPKPTKKTNVNVKNVKNTYLGSSILSKYIPSSWAKGDTSHLNKPSDVVKYASLTKYPGYYTFPTPGAIITQKLHGNNGCDLANHIGAPVLASANGVVRVAKTDGYNFGYGKYIIVTHPNGTETLYGHLSQVSVNPGQSVSRGEQIGNVGSTGNSTGPHLHFEIRGGYNPWAW